MKSAQTSDKPKWSVLESHTRFENKAMRVREDTVVLPNQETMQYAFAERGSAVIIVPITREGELVLLRQYRHPVQEWCLEVPAGTARDTKDMTLEEVAAKELEEEVGGQWAQVEHVGQLFSNPSLTDEVCHVYLATGVTFPQKPEREASEELHTLRVPVKEAVARVEAGEMKTGPAALAVFLCVPRLRALGLL